VSEAQKTAYVRHVVKLSSTTTLRGVILQFASMKASYRSEAKSPQTKTVAIFVKLIRLNKAGKHRFGSYKRIALNAFSQSKPIRPK
jgi:hypothetical protein